MRDVQDSIKNTRDKQCWMRKIPAYVLSDAHVFQTGAHCSSTGSNNFDSELRFYFICTESRSILALISILLSGINQSRQELTSNLIS